MKKLASILLSLLMIVGLVAGASAETFVGEDAGIGPVTVTLTVEDGKVTAAAVDTSKETVGIGAHLGEEFAQKIVDAQSAELDNVSGATVTTNAVKAATRKALEAAGLVEAEVVVVEDETAKEFGNLVSHM